MPNDMAIAPFAWTDGHGKSDIQAADNGAYFITAGHFALPIRQPAG
jgi:hypothetical protein